MRSPSNFQAASSRATERVTNPESEMGPTTEIAAPRAGAALLAVWVSGGVAAHFAFDANVAEWVDIPVVLSTWFLVVLTWGFSDAGWIRWPAWTAHVATSLIERLSRYRIQTGIDFGGTPEYARRLPPALVRLSLLIGSGIALLVSARDLFPGPARRNLLEVSGALYVPYVTVLWGWSLLLAVAACAVVGVHVNDMLVNRVHEPRARGRLQPPTSTGDAHPPSRSARSDRRGCPQRTGNCRPGYCRRQDRATVQSEGARIPR